MKKFFVALAILTMCFSLVACSSSESGQTSSVQTGSNSETSTQSSSETDSTEPKSGDNVSVTGQVASTIQGEDDDTISVQVQRDDGRWVIYHCQLKAEFLEDATELKMADIVTVNGLFLNMNDMEQENTAIIVNLYDCEVSK